MFHSMPNGIWICIINFCGLNYCTRKMYVPHYMIRLLLLYWCSIVFSKSHYYDDRIKFPNWILVCIFGWSCCYGAFSLVCLWPKPWSKHVTLVLNSVFYLAKSRLSDSENVPLKLIRNVVVLTACKASPKHISLFKSW